MLPQIYPTGNNASDRRARIGYYVNLNSNLPQLSPQIDSYYFSFRILALRPCIATGAHISQSYANCPHGEKRGWQCFTQSDNNAQRNKAITDASLILDNFVASIRPVTSCMPLELAEIDSLLMQQQLVAVNFFWYSKQLH
ncbi:hypothetical protein HZ326_17595 [Fusarium oxysporum f. sp. albedinis]|nr:hypothetical protein HZ326_17595 [Fusarium oxysporum f. sp. albedinis]